MSDSTVQHRFRKITPRCWADRVIAVLAAALLCACATQQEKPADWPQYKVDGTIGLVVTAGATAVKVAAADSTAATSLDAAAKKKRKEQSLGVGVTAFTILVAPLAILAPLYPPAIQLAILPFEAIGATSKAGQEADHLEQAAAKTRLDAACSDQLAASNPELPEKLQRAVAGDSLLSAIRTEVLESVQARTGMPVVPLDAQHSEDDSSRRDEVLKDAKAQAIDAVFAIDIQSLDFRAAAVSEKAGGGCRYAVTTTASLTWWNAKLGSLAYKADAFTHDVRLQLDSTDIPALVDRPEELRFQVARAYRDMVLPTLNAPNLKFANSQR